MKHLFLLLFSCFFIGCISPSTNPEKEIVRKENFLKNRQELGKKINNSLSSLISYDNYNSYDYYSLNYYSGVINRNHKDIGSTYYEWGSAYHWDNSFDVKINLWNQKLNFEALKNGIKITGKDKKLKIKRRRYYDNSFREEEVDEYELYSFSNKYLTIKKMKKLKDLLKKYSEFKKENK